MTDDGWQRTKTRFLSSDLCHLTSDCRERQRPGETVRYKPMRGLERRHGAPGVAAVAAVDHKGVYARLRRAMERRIFREALSSGQAVERGLQPRGHVGVEHRR